MDKKVLCVIPARMSSSRFPGKPLCMINGYPMVQWVYERVSRTGYPTVVATDHEDIADAVEKFGGRAVMTSSGHQTGTERISEAVTKHADEGGELPDIVLNVQGDEPLIRSEQIRQLAEGFDTAKHEMLTLVRPIDGDAGDLVNPDKCHVIKDKSGRALYFSRLAVPYAKASKPSARFLHVGIYAYRRDVLEAFVALPASGLEQNESLEQLRWLENGGSIHVLESPFSSLSIDTPADLDRVIEHLRQNPDIEHPGS